MLFAIIALALIIAFFRTPLGKGLLGEWVVRLIIGKTTCTSKKEQYVINNIIIQNSEGKSSQIDHILINSAGIFVLETKNYSGRIYGQESQLQWTQTLAYGKVKNKLYNPIKQNTTHILRLKELIKDEIPFYSLIVFVQGNTKYIQSNNVFNCFQIKEYIAQQPAFQWTSEDMKKIYNELLTIKNTSTITNKEHIQNINTMLNNIENDICPRCGGTLKIRKSSKGEFKGCSNYPKCKFTKKI